MYGEYRYYDENQGSGNPYADAEYLQDLGLGDPARYGSDDEGFGLDG